MLKPDTLALDFGSTYIYAAANISGKAEVLIRYPVSSSQARHLKRQPAADPLAILFNEAKQQAEKLSGQEFSAVVCALRPGMDSFKPILEQALQKSGFKAVDFVSEPESVLRAYGSKDGCFGVFHFGGGFFDISIFRLSGEKMERLAYEQDETIGGEDLTRRLADLCSEEISEQWNVDLKKNPSWAEKILDESEKAKISVAHRGSYDIRMQDPAKGKYVKAVSRYELMSVSQDLFDKMLSLTQKALQDSGLKAAAIDEIFLSGGSTRVPYVRDLIEKVFGKKPQAELNVDQVVVLGAALA